MAWGILGQNGHSVAGLHFEDGTFRIVQLDGRRRKVLRMIERRWPRRVLPGQKEGSSEKLGGLLRQAWRQGGFFGRQVTVALGNSDLFVQNLRLPQDTADIDAAVCNEAGSRLPFPLEEAELRYLPAGTIRQGDSLRQEVIVFACRRQVIAEKLALLEEAGLCCRALEAAPAALFRCYQAQLRRESDRRETIALVSIQQTGTIFLVSDRGQPHFIKHIDFSSGQLDEAVARYLGLSVEDAAGLRHHRGDRREEGRDPEVDRAIAEALEAPLDSLCHELIMCLRYCSVSFRISPPREVILSGVESNPELAQALAQRLNIRVRAGDPFLPLENAPATSHKGAWDIAVGLALWEES